jgi:hypothetical protein
MVTHDDADHLNYTKQQLVKHLGVLEEHFKNYRCLECLSKHLLLVQTYAEEGMAMDGADKQAFEKMRQWSELTLSALNKGADEELDWDSMIIEARTLRRSMQGEHKQFQEQKRKQLVPDDLEIAIGRMTDALEPLRDAIKRAAPADSANLKRAADYLNDAIELAGHTSDTEVWDLSETEHVG